MNEKLKMFDERASCLPKQKLSPWIRWSLRIIAYPFMMIDYYSTKITHFILRPKYKIQGQCKQSGNCCKYIHLSWPKKDKLNFFHKLYVWWQTEVLGFYFKDFDFIEDNEVTKVMGCRYLKSDQTCAHYRLRPGICRNWPKIHFLYKPSILKGCGYRVREK